MAVNFHGWVPLKGTGLAIPAFSTTGSQYDVTLEKLANAVGGEEKLCWLPKLNLTTINSYPPAGGTTSNFINDITVESPEKFFNIGRLVTVDGFVCGGITNIYNGVVNDKKYEFMWGYGSYNMPRTYHTMILTNLDATSPLDITKYHLMLWQPISSSSSTIWFGIGTSGTVPNTDFGYRVFSDYNHLNAITSFDKFEVYQEIEEAQNAARPDNPYTPPNAPGGLPSGTGGGGGSFDINPGDPQDIPDGMAGISLADTGLYTKYLVNSSQLEYLADKLWSTDFINSLINVFRSPIDTILGIETYPFDLSTYIKHPDNKFIALGNVLTTVSAPVITNEGGQIDWGTINIAEFYGSALDYSPYTKLQIYLPWGTGFADLNVNEFMNGSISVKTNFEIAHGSCTHSVFNHQGKCVATYSGSVSCSLPIASQNNRFAKQFISAAIGVGAASATNSIISNAPSPPAIYNPRVAIENATRERVSGDIRTALYNGARTVASGEISYQRSGAFTDGANFCSVQYPFVIISRPEQSVPNNMGNLLGYPSNIYSTLSSLTGFTKIRSIHLEGIPATSSELDELDSILRGGVIF